MLNENTITIVKSTAPVQTWGMPLEQIHFEFFGPRQELEIPQTLAV